MYVVVDIETTGGKPENSKITEIAVYRLENGMIVDELVSLINPCCYIPDYIEHLTGISNDMVENAPRFHEVAKRLVEITKDATFVAHNASFDYGFIKAEFASLGYIFEMPTLCTVKLSRVLLPGHRSYSLGNLCHDLGITIKGRHRAGGDALATVQLFELLLEANGGMLMPDDPYKKIDFSSFPSSLDESFVRSLPDTAGVYCLVDSNKHVIFVGHSKRIRWQVLDHLMGGRTKSSVKMATEIADIDYWETGSELVALLKEAEEIRHHQPLYNKAKKKSKLAFGIYNYYDRKGYMRFAIKRNGEVVPPLVSFPNFEDAQKILYQWVEEYSLCQKLSGLYESNHGCFQYQLKQCNGACVGEETADAYNQRAEQLVAQFEFGKKSMVIVEKGRRTDEKAIVVIEKGCYLGYGFIDDQEPVTDVNTFKDFIAVKEDNSEARQIIKQYIKAKRPLKIINY